MPISFRSLGHAVRLVTLVAVAGPQVASAQSNVAAQWNFNSAGSATAPTASLTNSAGTPAASLLGGTLGDLPDASGGGSTDPTSATPNIAWSISGYPAAGTGSGTAGVRFNVPTTTGFNNLFVRFDQQLGDVAGAHHRFEYTTDGTTWAGGTTFRGAIDGEFVTRSFDLSAVSAANNNASFGFRVTAAFAPGGSDYQAAGFLADPAGFAYDPSGVVRYDMVTVSRGVNWLGGSGTNVAAAANWQGGATPGAADTLVFGASANTAVNVDATATYGHLVFRGATNYTFTATAGQVLRSDVGLANLGTGTQTFNTPVAFNRSATVESNGRVVFNGNVTVTLSGGSNRLQLIGSGTTAFNAGYTGGAISVGEGHTLAGAGVVNGGILVYGGKVRGGLADGTNNFGTLTMNRAATDVQLFAAPGALAPTVVVEASRTGAGTASNSRIAIAGGSNSDLELNNAGVGTNKLRFELLANNLVANERYNLTVFTSDSTGSVEFNNVPRANGFIFPSTSYDLISSNHTFADVQIQVVDVGGGSTLVLAFTPVPEPASVLGVAVVGVAVGGWVRRRVVRRANR